MLKYLITFHDQKQRGRYRGGETEGKRQRGRDREEIYRRRDIRETKGKRQKGTDREEETKGEEEGKRQRGTDVGKETEGKGTRRGRGRGKKRGEGHVRYTRGDLPLHPPIRRIFSFNLNK